MVINIEHGFILDNHSHDAFEEGSVVMDAIQSEKNMCRCRHLNGESRTGDLLFVQELSHTR